MENLTPNIISDLERQFNPKGQIVNKLPLAKDVRDFAEIAIKNADGTYDTYKMLEGKWIKIGTNISEITKIINESTSGGSGTAEVKSFNGRKGAVIPQTNDYTWNQIDKTISDVADITDRSHTDLQDIGTYTHDEIDAKIDAAIHDDVAGEINAITEKTVLVDDDEVMIEDSEDSYNKKKVKVSNLPGSGTGDLVLTSLWDCGDSSSSFDAVGFDGGDSTVLTESIILDGGSS